MGSKKTVLGYYYKIGGESVSDALVIVGGLGSLFATREKVIETLREDLDKFVITPRHRPRIFKVVVEVEDEPIELGKLK